MLAQLLRELRGARTVEDVANALGLNRSAIYLWEATGDNARTGRAKHRRLPEPDRLEALLQFYAASEDQRKCAYALLAQEKRLARLARNAASESSEDSDPERTPGPEEADTELDERRLVSSP